MTAEFDYLVTAANAIRSKTAYSHTPATIREAASIGCTTLRRMVSEGEVFDLYRKVQDLRRQDEAAYRDTVERLSGAQQSDREMNFHRERRERHLQDVESCRGVFVAIERELCEAVHLHPHIVEEMRIEANNLRLAILLEPMSTEEVKKKAERLRDLTCDLAGRLHSAVDAKMMGGALAMGIAGSALAVIGGGLVTTGNATLVGSIGAMATAFGGAILGAALTRLEAADSTRP